MPHTLLFYLEPKYKPGPFSTEHGSFYVVGDGEHIHKDFTFQIINEAITLVIGHINAYIKPPTINLWCCSTENFAFVVLFRINRLMVFNWLTKLQRAMVETLLKPSCCSRVAPILNISSNIAQTLEKSFNNYYSINPRSLWDVFSKTIPQSPSSLWRNEIRTKTTTVLGYPSYRQTLLE